MALLLAAGGLIFAGILLDHTLTLQRSGRTVFFWTFAVVCVGGVLVATLLPLLLRVSRLFVARQIEHSQPELKNSLISYLQCNSDPRVPAEVKELLKGKASLHVRKADPLLMEIPS